MQVHKIIKQPDLDLAFAIRRQVFVIEQAVAAEEEFDEFENESRHFLATSNGKAVGTARWRFTPKGIKLERFAVLEEARGRGVGKALVAAVLVDIEEQPESAEKMCYLHAQLTAMPLYAHFNFQPEGGQFDECNIIHQKMVLKL